MVRDACSFQEFEVWLPNAANYPQFDQLTEPEQGVKARWLLPPGGRYDVAAECTSGAEWREKYRTLTKKS